MAFIRKIRRAIIDFCYYSSAYGITRELMQQRAELDTILMLLILGDDLGVPVFPSYYSHRLWPYLLPRMAWWKRTLLRPKRLGNW
ncbi:MAG: hypothetical protein AB1801_03130 [Chloroflexota bacterium]